MAFMTESGDGTDEDYISDYQYEEANTDRALAYAKE